MKIAFIYDAVYPFVTGGAEKRVYEVAKRLAQRGHEVHWYGVGWWWPEKGQKNIKMDGIHLHGVCKPVEFYVDGKRSIKEAIYFALKLFPQLRKEKFDIIDCQSFPYFSCFTAKLYSFKQATLFVTWIEVWDDYWYEYIGKKGILGKIVEKLTIKLTKNIIAISEKTKKDLKSAGVNGRIDVVPVGVDIDKIGKIRPSENKSEVIFAGRLIKEKNVDVLIRSIKLVKKTIPDIKCIVIGDGPEKENLEKLANDLKIDDNIKFMGFLEDHDEMISYLKSSKVFVLPSTREGFGIVVIEANACGLPVVVVDHKMNAAMDLINDHRNGFISTLSELDMANKIIIGIKNKEKMQDECIENAKQFDWEEIADSLESLYLNCK